MENWCLQSRHFQRFRVFNEVVLGDAPALGAILLAFGPAHVSDEGQSNVFVSEVLDGFEEGVRGVHGSFHSLNVVSHKTNIP